MKRAEVEADQMPGQDSFLDVVTNIVGVLILLVLVVGLRTSQSVKDAPDTGTAERARGEAELQKAYNSAVTSQRNVQELVKRVEKASFESAFREDERSWLSAHVAVAEKEIEERAEEINSLETNRAAALKDFDAELAKNKKEFEADTKKREEVFTTLPAQLAAIYNRMAQRSRDGIAVAQVINGSCSACFMSLRPQMQVEVKRGDQIITCESCSRILYIPRKEEQSEATAS